MNELLLTPEQMANVYITKAKPAIIDADGHSDWRYESAFCEAQLTHCTPLIEKAERERILKALPKNPWAESDNRGCNPDKRVAVDIILDNVRQALKSD